MSAFRHVFMRRHEEVASRLHMYVKSWWVWRLQRQPCSSLSFADSSIMSCDLGDKVFHNGKPHLIKFCTIYRYTFLSLYAVCISRKVSGYFNCNKYLACECKMESDSRPRWLLHYKQLLHPCANPVGVMPVWLFRAPHPCSHTLPWIPQMSPRGQNGPTEDCWMHQTKKLEPDSDFSL